MGSRLNDIKISGLRSDHQTGLSYGKSTLQQWLQEWGEWILLWQNTDLEIPDPEALFRLRDWKKSLPSGSFQELHELLDQLLLEETSQSEKLAVLQILKNWQRAMLRQNSSAQAARV